jgi:hypothetical protein
VDLMAAGHSYSFPIYRRIGQATRALVASRHWILVVLTVVILLYLPFLFSGFFQDDHGHRLAFSPEAYEKLNMPAEVMRNGPLNLYGFSWDSSRRFELLREKGFAPWWTSEAIKTSFFRPLSSLTLALDYSLWPATPLVMHAHSLLWFCLLVVLTYRLYRSVSGSPVAAGLSILLFAVDDVFAGPAGWISNRHAVIAMVFGVLCLWLYHQGTSKQKWSSVAGAYGAFVLALLASEMGLVILAYLFACAVVLDRDTLLGRVKRFLPFILIVVVWRVVYSGLGYGAQGTLLYIDPILNPFGFLTALLTRYPLLLFSAVGLPVADILVALSPQAVTTAALLSLILLGLLALSVYPVLKPRRASAFWVIGLLGAIVPLVSGIPGNRNLGLVGLGVMGLAGQLFVDVATMEKTNAPTTPRLILLRIATPILLFLYLVVSPLLVVSNPATTRMMSKTQASVVSFGSAPTLARQHVYVINPPGTMIYLPGLLERPFTDEPIPASLNYLSSGLTSVAIRRQDSRRITVTPDGGYTLPPGPVVDEKTGIVMHVHEENVYRALEGLTYNPQNPMRAGQVVALAEFTVEVAGMTSDGRIASAVFTFASPLDDERYRWLRWDKATSTYEVVHMPPVGESRVYR